MNKYIFGEEKITPKKEIAKRRLLLTRTNGTCFGQFLTSQEYELRILGENYHYSFEGKEILNSSKLALG